MQATGQPCHRGRIGALLGAEDLGRALEGSAHVAQHEHPCAAQAAGLLDRGDRPRAAVGGRASADGDQDRGRAGAHGGDDQLARAARRGGFGIALVPVDQPQPRGLGHLDHRCDPVLEQCEPGTPRPPERVGDPRADGLSAQREQQRLHRPLAAVGDRQRVGRAPSGLGARVPSPPPPGWRGTSP